MANLTWIILLVAMFGCVYASQQIGEKCKKHTDCESTLDCRNGTCQCFAGESFFEGRCVPRVGAYCSKPADCQITWTTCKNNKCTCKHGFVDYGDRCVTGVGTSCGVDAGCEADNTFCSDRKICECRPKFAATPHSTCAPFAYHHDHCEYDSQCSSAVPNTFCNVTDESQRCECTTKYFYADGKCHQKKYVPEKCDRQDECFTPNSHCEKGKCACQPNHELVEGACRGGSNSLMISRPLFFFVVLVLMGMKVLS